MHGPIPIYAESKGLPSYAGNLWTKFITYHFHFMYCCTGFIPYMIAVFKQQLRGCNRLQSRLKEKILINKCIAPPLISLELYQSSTSDSWSENLWLLGQVGQGTKTGLARLKYVDVLILFENLALFLHRVQCILPQVIYGLYSTSTLFKIG